MEMADLSAAARRKRQVPCSNSSGNISNNDPSTGSIALEARDRSPDSTKVSTLAVWTYVAAIWLTIISVPLLAFPRFLLFLSSTRGEHRDDLTPLESFLSTHFAIFALSGAVGLIASIPPGSPVDFPRQTSPGDYHPLLLPVTTGMLLSAFLSYNTPSSQIGPLALLTAIGAGVTGLWGVFALLFSGSSSVSHKTGADKHTSRFIFGNRSAASAKKEEWKKGKKAANL